jgi:hypothetical protein
MSESKRRLNIRGKLRADPLRTVEKARAKRQTTAAASIVRAATSSPERRANEVRAASAYLRDQTVNEAVAEFQDAIRTKSYKHVRNSNNSYYKALSEVYAFERRLTEWPDEALTDFLKKVDHGKLTKKQTLLHVLLRMAIRYPDDKISKRNSTKQLSRDARAIMRAIELGITPETFAATSRGSFAGLDRMAKEFSAGRKASSVASSERDDRSRPATFKRDSNRPGEEHRLLPPKAKKVAEIRGAFFEIGTYILIVSSMERKAPSVEASFRLHDQPFQGKPKAEQALAMAVAAARPVYEDVVEATSR